MKTILVLGTLFIVGFVISIKSALAILFFGSCIGICLWINSTFKGSATSKMTFTFDEEFEFVIESYDGIYERYTMY